MDEPRKIIAHIDIDMFYAAVILRTNPELRGKPLIIGNPSARETRRGVVLTCSYEARKFGVHSGMPMSEALRRCPQAIIMKSNYEDNKKTSTNIMNYLKTFNVPIRVASIDEAYLDITDLVTDIRDAYPLTKKIQKWIYEHEKITVSIGVAHTKIIAKIASDYRKPEAVTIVTLSGLEEFFSDLKLSKIPGIGKVMYHKLDKMGFNNTGQLISMGLTEMKSSVGSIADFLYRIFNAETSADLTSRSERKSISHETTFHGTPHDIPKYLEKIDYVFQKTLNELGSKNLIAKTITVKIRFNGFDTITRSKTLFNYTNDKGSIYKTMLNIALPHFDDSRGIRLIGFKLSQFKNASLVQSSLIDFI